MRGGRFASPCRGSAADVHAAHSVPSTRARQEHFRDVQLPLRILKLGPFCKMELPAPLYSSSYTHTSSSSSCTTGASSSNSSPCCCSAASRAQTGRRGGAGGHRACLQIRQEGVGGLGGQERQLSGDTARAWRTAEQATQLADRQAIHHQL